MNKGFNHFYPKVFFSFYLFLMKVIQNTYGSNSFVLIIINLKIVIKEFV